MKDKMDEIATKEFALIKPKIYLILVSDSNEYKIGKKCENKSC